MDVSAGGPALTGTTRSLGLEGLTAEIPGALPVGLEVSLRVTAWSLPLQTRATVLSCLAVGDDRHIAEFAFPPDMSVAEREILARFVATRGRRLG